MSTKTENKYLDSIVGKLYRRQLFDIMVFTYIDAARSLIPMLSVAEAAAGFMKRYKINQELLSINSIQVSYYRTQKMLSGSEKEENQP